MTIRPRPALRHAVHAFTVALFVAQGAALAHPGHEGGGASEGHPAILLAQAEPPTKRENAAAGTGKAEHAVTITAEGDYRIVKSNGWPDHPPGAFPRRGNPNVLLPQSYTFRIPLKPAPAAAPERRGGWWWGVAINGVPFEPGTAETWQNDPRSGWRYEAATGFLNLGLDEHNAHVQPTGAYHYHALPTGLIERLGGDGKKMLLLGWAADGFPIYSSWAHAEAGDATSALRKVKSSYQLRKGARPQEVGGPGGEYDGRFTQDFEYVPGSGDLDECNGRTGVTPELPGGGYYYCLTAEFPFVPRMWRGTPDPSFSKGERPPGAGPRPAAPGGPPRGILEDGAGPAVSGAAPNSPFPGQPRGTGQMPPLARALDLNHDGILQSDELAKAAESLRTLDRNGDGKLTPDEFRGGAPGGRDGPP